jgi:hypothetical protein
MAAADRRIYVALRSGGVLWSCRVLRRCTAASLRATLLRERWQRKQKQQGKKR